MTRLLFLCLLVASSLLSARAQAPAAPLRIALAGAEPFVMPGRDGKPSGFSVELWQNIATANGWKYAFRAFDTTDDAIDAVARGECDLLVGDTSITSERERRVEFSQPYYRAGLQVMVGKPRSPLAQFLDRLLEPQHVKVLGSVLAGVIIATFVIAAFERRHNPDFPKTTGAGLAESFYYVMGLVLGKSSYKGFPGVLGRLVLVGWMVASLFVVVYVQGVFSASMTADLLLGHIHGPQDLPGKSVGLVAGTESESFARQKNLEYSAFPTLEAAVAELTTGKVQCLVGDAPVLQYFDLVNSRLPVREVGPVFQPVNYGFTFAQNSPLREPVNLALLHLFEAGDIEALGEKYFGASYQQ